MKHAQYEAVESYLFAPQMNRSSVLKTYHTQANISPDASTGFAF